MQYSREEVKQYVVEEDVKFVRMAFTDVYGKQKNVAIVAEELDRAFQYGIAIDGSAIRGFGDVTHSDLFLHPDTSTLAALPWRPEHGRVIRMFCDIRHPDGSTFEFDTRAILKKAIDEAAQEGISFAFGSEMEFYLFRCDEEGNSTKQPYDQAGYLDIAPDDKGENVRREVCLVLEQMGIHPESSHHEEGPGQNEIDFRYSDAMTAADNAVTFKAVVNTIAARSGLHADFDPKPLDQRPGNGMHINISAKSSDGRDIMPQVIAGILNRIRDITLFLNPTENSYKRLGCNKAPRFVSWSDENRSQLIRIPAAQDQYRRAELRSPDPMCNPYLAFALLIYAGLEGIRNQTKLPEPAEFNLYQSTAEAAQRYQQLPGNLFEAQRVAEGSEFIAEHLPGGLIEYFVKG